MLSLRRSRKSKPQPQEWDAFDDLWGGWNYPKPVYENGSSWHPGGDGHLKHLIYMAEHGWYYCQKAFVGMAFIHPLTDYRPAVVDDEFRETFMARYNDEDLNKRIPLTIYERDGKLIMSNDWEAYWLYREVQESSVPCILIGHFTPNPDIMAVYDKPFMITKATEFAE
ncbi:MAG TPA: hypothetical protein VNE40_01130 [Candidatus Dormibacteraeota bacterium]|nr:hypothetical protein [Candidatus Dormibacteraeota bacterium]